jgi:membrane protease YdiL (CAAX protease family)
MKRFAVALALALGGLVVVYVPTFVLAAFAIKSGAFGSPAASRGEPVVVPLIICISAAIALTLIAALAQYSTLNPVEFGFKAPAVRSVTLALMLGLLFAAGLRGLSLILPIGNSPDLGDMHRWQIIAYFWLGAPIQEEIIFRGLLQTIFQARDPRSALIGSVALPFSVFACAAIFAAVHVATVRLGASPAHVAFIVFGAFVLGVLAGYLRWKSSSLLPAIAVHAVFNMFAS